MIFPGLYGDPKTGGSLKPIIACLCFYIQKKEEKKRLTPGSSHLNVPATRRIRIQK